MFVKNLCRAERDGCGGSVATSTQAKAESDTRAHTAQGAVEGFLKNGRGRVPGHPLCRAAPVGSLRWRPAGACLRRGQTCGNATKSR